MTAEGTWSPTVCLKAVPLNSFEKELLTRNEDRGTELEFLTLPDSHDIKDGKHLGVTQLHDLQKVGPRYFPAVSYIVPMCFKVSKKKYRCFHQKQSLGFASTYFTK